MHQVASRPQSNQRGAGGGITPQAILVIAITMFALSGLLIGFAVGAFARPASPRANLPKQSGVTAPVHSPTATQPPAIQPVPLGCPQIETTSSAYTADGTTTYTLSAQAKDKSVSICNPNNKSVASAGILCKLWLVPRIPNGQNLLFPKEDARLKHADLTAPLTGSIQNTDYAEVPGLQFDPTTSQVQPCNAQGQGSWKYTVAPTVPPGNYDLVVMNDWSTGRYFNWTWIIVTIKAAK